MMACGGGGLDQTSVARQSVHALCIYARLTLVYFLNCIFTVSLQWKKEERSNVQFFNFNLFYFRNRYVINIGKKSIESKWMIEGNEIKKG